MISDTRHRHIPCRGFSLLEVTVTLGLIGIVSAIALPTLARQVHHRRLLAETNALRLFLERAYAHALAYQDRATVQLTSNHAITQSESGTPLESYDLRNAITLDLGAKKELLIECYSTIAMSPYTITLRGHGESCSLIIALRGRIRSTC